MFTNLNAPNKMELAVVKLHVFVTWTFTSKGAVSQLQFCVFNLKLSITNGLCTNWKQHKI